MSRITPLAITLSVLTLAAAVVRADDPPPKAWKNQGEFSLVSTNGNSKATTTSVKDTFNYKWSKAALELVGGALGARNGDDVTAEQYNASEKLSYPLTENQKNYVFEKFGWEKNRFAGFKNRWDGSGGYGREIFNVSSNTLIGEIGAGYIDEERIDAPRNEFASGRAYTKYTRVLSATSHFSQDAEYLHHFGDQDDYRLNMESAITATIVSHLALKASFKWNRVARPPPGFGRDDTTTSVALVMSY